MEENKEYKLDYSNNSHPTSSIKAREIYSLINKVTKVPPEQVQDVFQTYSLIIEYCLIHGIDIPLPYIGNFQCRIRKGHKAGVPFISMPKGAICWTRGEDGRPAVLKAEEDIWKTLEEDEPDYIAPHFKFMKKLRSEVKEKTRKQCKTGEVGIFESNLINNARKQEKGVSKPKPNCHKKKVGDK